MENDGDEDGDEILTGKIKLITQSKYILLVAFFLNLLLISI
jgi:hypothetical protein